MRISDWSSDVCSSDLLDHGHQGVGYAEIRGTLPAIAVGADGAGQPVDDLFAIAGDALLDTIVEAGPPPEREGGGDRKSVVQGKSVSVRVALGGRIRI